MTAFERAWLRFVLWLIRIVGSLADFWRSGGSSRNTPRLDDWAAHRLGVNPIRRRLHSGWLRDVARRSLGAADVAIKLTQRPVFCFSPGASPLRYPTILAAAIALPLLFGVASGQTAEEARKAEVAKQARTCENMLVTGHPALGDTHVLGRCSQAASLGGRAAR